MVDDDQLVKWLFDLTEEYNTVPVESEFHHLVELFELRHYKKGEFFIKPGEDADRFGIIYKGISKYYYLDDQGKEYIKEFEKEGGMIGPYSELLQGIRSRTHIQFLEDTSIFVADYPKYQELEKKYPWVRELSFQVLRMNFIRKEEKEYEFMQFNAQNRYQKFSEDFPDIVKRIPQHQVAGYLGVTPVALSRIVKRLKNERQNQN